VAVSSRAHLRGVSRPAARNRLDSIERLHSRLANRATGMLEGPAPTGPFVISDAVLA
jgi:hypothetical protein